MFYFYLCQQCRFPSQSFVGVDADDPRRNFHLLCLLTSSSCRVEHFYIVVSNRYDLLPVNHLTDAGVKKKANPGSNP